MPTSGGLLTVACSVTVPFGRSSVNNITPRMTIKVKLEKSNAYPAMNINASPYPAKRPIVTSLMTV